MEGHPVRGRRPRIMLRSWRSAAVAATSLALVAVSAVPALARDPYAFTTCAQNPHPGCELGAGQGSEPAARPARKRRRRPTAALHRQAAVVAPVRRVTPRSIHQNSPAAPTYAAPSSRPPTRPSRCCSRPRRTVTAHASWPHWATPEVYVCSWPRPFRTGSPGPGTYTSVRPRACETRCTDLGHVHGGGVRRVMPRDPG